MSRFRVSFALPAAILLVVAAAPASDDGPATTNTNTKTNSKQPPVAAEPLAPDEIAQLVKDLDANQFAVREAASQKLAAAGKAAIPELAKAAGGEGLEAAMRSIAILRKHYQEGDAPTRAAAKEALEKTAKSENRAAAQAAADALKPRLDAPPNSRWPGGIQIDPGQIQIHFAGGAGPRSRTYSSRTVNGVREIDVKEDDRSVKIHDDPKSGIKLEVTEKKDGKDETKKYEAKSADELKEKQPEAFKLYEEYTKPQNNIQIMRGQFPGIEFPPEFAGRLGRFGFGMDVTEQLDSAQRSLDAAAKLIKKRTESGDKSDELKKALEQLGEAKRQLDDARARSRR